MKNVVLLNLGTMKKSKFSKVQIIKILAQQEQGSSVSDICREYGISQGKFDVKTGKYTSHNNYSQAFYMKRSEGTKDDLTTNLTWVYPNNYGAEGKGYSNCFPIGAIGKLY